VFGFTVCNGWTRDKGRGECGDAALLFSICIMDILNVRLCLFFARILYSAHFIIIFREKFIVSCYNLN
jgi:hypothetical protein